MIDSIDSGEAKPPQYAILLRTHEVAIKGNNRSWFENRLIINIRRLLKREHGLPEGQQEDYRITREQSRILLHAPWDDATHAALSRAFGLTGFSPMRIVKSDKAIILKAAIEELRANIAKNGLPASFRVRTRRSDKLFNETSLELDHFFGGEINELFPQIKIDLENPALTLGIEIRAQYTYVWTQKFPGPGGLPAGTNGSLLALLSGGIDSPVAALQMIRRGGALQFVHFHGTPFVGDEALDKVQRLAKLVNRYQSEPLPLWVIPFGLIQEKIARETDPKLRTVLYRRMMIRIATELAHKLECKALVTGESLGQVASQTLSNLSTINEVTTLPILRPLIGFDKEEIVTLSKKWETYTTSIEPTGDCCTLFADRHPNLKTTSDLVRAQESRFSVEDLVKEALAAGYRGKF